MGSSSRPEPIVAAGAVVLRETDGQTQIAVVHRPRYDDWSLPKGKQEPDEHVLATAVREVHEETGLRVALRRPLPSREYLVSGQPKVVHYWLALVLPGGDDEPFVPNREVDRIEWLTPAAAEARLTQPRDAELVEFAVAQPPGTPLVILRHAKARGRSSWKGDELTRPLTPIGAKNAKALVPLLGAYDVRRLHPSSATRCVRTVKPYASSATLGMLEEPLFTEEAFEDEPATALSRASSLLRSTGVSGEATVLCTHRPVIPQVIGHLLEGSGLVGPTETLPTAAMVVLHVSVDELAGTERVLAVETHTL